MLEDFNYNLSGKVAVVTGAASGIGFAIAESFLQNGAKTAVLLDVNEDKGLEAAVTLKLEYGTDRADFMKCDVTTDLAQVSRKILSVYKTVDILVNSAGVADTNWQRCIDINLSAVIAWSMAFKDHVRTDRGGSGGTIINISSIYGFRVEPYASVYQAAKFGVMGFTRSFGHKKNFESSGVRVIAICPGFTETGLASASRIRDSEGEFAEYLRKQSWQLAEAVGAVAVEVYRSAATGTAWLSENGQPAEEITAI